MTAPHLVSHAQNGEDVVLWRALHAVQNGRYVEVGANSPMRDSITRAFYDAGWSGVTVEPVAAFAAEHRRQRPRDTLVQAAITSADTESIALYQIDDTGLSTTIAEVSERHYANDFHAIPVEVAARKLSDVLAQTEQPGAEIHFMTVDTEGSERTVLESMDFKQWRPWVLVIESTAPLTNTPTWDAWEDLVLSAGYTFCLFDGLSRFYVADEHLDLFPLLRYPACVLDNFERPLTADQIRSTRELIELRDRAAKSERELAAAARDVIRWRALAIENLARRTPSSAAAGSQLDVQAMQATLSWRITAPLRKIRRSLETPVRLARRIKNSPRFR